MTLLLLWVRLPVLTHWPPAVATSTPFVAPPSTVTAVVAELAVENLSSPALTVVLPV